MHYNYNTSFNGLWFHKVHFYKHSKFLNKRSTKLLFTIIIHFFVGVVNYLAFQCEMFGI